LVVCEKHFLHDFKIGIDSKNADKLALVLGAGGFIGGRLVKRLKREGFWVRGVDLKFSPFAETEADDFVIGDLATHIHAASGFLPASTVNHNLNEGPRDI
jgi:NAD(P)-dependent dehydrogenase (short-subunit alcohol dehydrogenase family)